MKKFAIIMSLAFFIGLVGCGLGEQGSLFIEKASEREVLAAREVSTVSDVLAAREISTASEVLTASAISAESEILTSMAVIAQSTCVELNPTMTITEINTALANGGSFLFKAGTYNVTQANGIKCASNSIISFEQGVLIKQTTLDATHYDMILLQNCKNVILNNPTLQGEGATHVGTEGEWQHGITIYGCENILINRPVITDTWGDGIYIGLKYWTPYTYNNKSINIMDVVIDNCGRNGILVGSNDGVTIIRPKISRIKRVAPRAGINIEPEYSSQDGIFSGKVIIRDAEITDCTYTITSFLSSVKPGTKGVIDIKGVTSTMCDFGIFVRNFAQTNYDINIRDCFFDKPNYYTLGFQDILEGCNVTFSNFTTNDRRTLGQGGSATTTMVYGYSTDMTAPYATINFDNFTLGGNNTACMFLCEGTGTKANKLKINNLNYDGSRADILNPFFKFTHGFTPAITNQNFFVNVSTYQTPMYLTLSNFSTRFMYVSPLTANCVFGLRNEAPDGEYEIVLGQSKGPHNITFTTDTNGTIYYGDGPCKTLYCGQYHCYLKVRKSGSDFFVINSSNNFIAGATAIPY